MGDRGGKEIKRVTSLGSKENESKEDQLLPRPTKREKPSRCGETNGKKKGGGRVQ